MGITYPQFHAVTNRGNWVRWTGTLKPTEWSSIYTVEISYKVPARPDILVVSPLLIPRADCERIPHVFSGNKLCVHQAHEWDGSQIITETIVPWTSFWLYFYEVWFATGLWHGEGTHPDLRQHRSTA